MKKRLLVFAFLIIIIGSIIIFNFIQINVSSQGVELDFIGIPLPEFGINENHLMYSGQKFDFNNNGLLEQGEEYKNAGNGPYTHYIDSTHSSSTDTNNPYGSPNKPRKTIPTTLSAGSVVEIHNKVDINTGKLYITLAGTAEKPIFVRSPDVNNKPVIEKNIVVKGPYSIWENLKIHNHRFEIRPHLNSNAHHVVLRNSEIYGEGVFGVIGGVVVSGEISNQFHDIIIYNNHIHHIGDSEAITNNDIAGVSIGKFVERIWILNNHIHHMGGDSIVMGHEAQFTAKYIYIAGNEMHDDRENAVDIKQADQVFVSQNKIYNYAPTSSSDGEAIAAHFGSRNVFILYNEISNAQRGIDNIGASNFYIIGNIIYGMTQMKEDTHTDDSVHRPGNGIRTYNTDNVYILNNIIYDTAVGIAVEAQTSAEIANNIVSEQKNTPRIGYHLILKPKKDYNPNIILKNNLFYQSNNVIRKTTLYNCLNCLEQNPLFVNALNNNFKLQSNSPAIDSGAISDVYNKFYQTYGKSIAVDFEKNSRPKGSSWDIGVFEYEKISTPSCNKNLDCGTNNFINSYSCKETSENVLYQIYKTYTCNNPGTSLSYCSSMSEDILKENCGINSWCDSNVGLCVDCPNNYINCNGVRADGCEAYLLEDENNCGLCSKKCDVNEQCINGVCIVQDSCKDVSCGTNAECSEGVCVCNSGYIDCDNNILNGCENLESIGCVECQTGAVKNCLNMFDCAGQQKCTEGFWNLCEISYECFPGESELCKPQINGKECEFYVGQKTCDVCGVWKECITSADKCPEIIIEPIEPQGFFEGIKKFVYEATHSGKTMVFTIIIMIILFFALLIGIFFLLKEKDKISIKLFLLKIIRKIRGLFKRKNEPARI